MIKDDEEGPEEKRARIHQLNQKCKNNEAQNCKLRQQSQKCD